ncbi:MAG TPA: hypothetical protein VFX98_07145, partial [Longimicrobiaceae bacterium]|nr:hypothetical protein [Longimicrobiaceae bacterium]
RRVLRAAHRHPHRTAAALALLHLALALLAFQPAPHPGGDNATYLALARSLLEDGAYRDLFDPARPPHTQFPPVFPALEAAALALGVRPWVGLKLLTVAFSVAGVALTWYWLRRRRRPGLALGVALLAALSPGVLELSHWELSDVPFWAFTTAALLAWERLPPRRHGRAALAAFLTTLAYLTRSAGLPLVVAAAGWLALRRRWRQLGILAAVLGPPALLWWLRGRASGGYASLILFRNPYAPAQGTADAGDLARRAAENLASYGGGYLPRFLTGSEGVPAAGLGMLLVGLAAWGWARRLRRPGVAELWVPLYLAMLLAWPVEWGGERLLLPLFPALLMYAGDGVARLARLARVPPVPAGAAAAAVLLLAALPGVGEVVREGRECTAQYRAGSRYPCQRPEWEDFYALAEEARRTLPDGAVVISRKPALFWAVSGLPGRNYPLDREPAGLFAAADEAGARYLVLDYIDAVAVTYLTPVLMRRPQAFCVLQGLGPERAALLGIHPGAAAMPDLRGDPGASEMTVGFRRCGPEFTKAARPPPA